MLCLHFETSLIESFKIKKTPIQTHLISVYLCPFLFLSKNYPTNSYLFSTSTVLVRTQLSLVFWAFLGGGWVNLVRGNIFMLVFTAISMTVYEL